MNFRKPKGTKDILPNNINNWHYIEDIIRNITKIFNFKEIRTPTFEYTDLFKRSIGSETDIVGKEMYTFLDKGNESLTLRAEGTAPIIRAFIENGFKVEPPPFKLYYLAKMFRYERPQAGRFREHTQFGAELIGTNDIHSDIEIIYLAYQFYKRCDIKNVTLKINSIGKPEERKNYINIFKNYLLNFKSEFSEDELRKFEKNPLRLLDIKKQVKYLLEAPQILPNLSVDSQRRFDILQNKLSLLNIDFKIDHKLVRGLDYYNDTIFEFVTDSLGSQDALGGGGRYDYLFNQFNEKEYPAVGFGIGLERVLLALENSNTCKFKETGLDCYLITDSKETKQLAFDTVLKLRNKKISCDLDLLGRNIKTQMKQADRNNSKIIISLVEENYSNSQINFKHKNNSKLFLYSEFCLNIQYNFDKLDNIILFIINIYENCNTVNELNEFYNTSVTNLEPSLKTQILNCINRVNS